MDFDDYKYFTGCSLKRLSGDNYMFDPRVYGDDPDECGDEEKNDMFNGKIFSSKFEAHKFIINHERVLTLDSDDESLDEKVTGFQTKHPGLTIIRCQKSECFYFNNVYFKSKCLRIFRGPVLSEIRVKKEDLPDSVCTVVVGVNVELKPANVHTHSFHSFVRNSTYLFTKSTNEVDNDYVLIEIYTFYNNVCVVFLDENKQIVKCSESLVEVKSVFHIYSQQVIRQFLNARYVAPVEEKSLNRVRVKRLLVECPQIVYRPINVDNEMDDFKVIVREEGESEEILRQNRLIGMYNDDSLDLKPDNVTPIYVLERRVGFIATWEHWLTIGYYFNISINFPCAQDDMIIYATIFSSGERELVKHAAYVEITGDQKHSSHILFQNVIGCRKHMLRIYVKTNHNLNLSKPMHLEAKWVDVRSVREEQPVIITHDFEVYTITSYGFDQSNEQLFRHSGYSTSNELEYKIITS